MITLTSVVRAARQAYANRVKIRYVHPLVYLIVLDESFAGLDEDARRSQFSKKTELPITSAEWSTLEATLSLVLVTSTERQKDLDFLDSPDAGEHWLPLFDPDYRAARQAVNAIEPKAIHFYGYKGGQARSTVLVMLARQLADDGYKVLTVDADIEAPSLNVLLDTSATDFSQTLLGMVDTKSDPHPLSAYKARLGGGCVDLLSCRPSAPDFDMDFAAFAVKTALDVTILERATRRLLTHIGKMKSSERYDVVLYDHRSGLAASILPMLRAHPGPTVICLRIDDQSISAISLIEILFSQVKDVPGAFVSFSLDPEENREKTLRRYEDRIGAFLSTLGTAIERGAEDASQEPMSPDELSRYWVSWFHDRAFLSDRFPKPTEISEANRQSLHQLREVLGFSGKKFVATVNRKSKPPKKLPALAPSGAVDQGFFVEPSEFSRLFQQNTPISYIFGRKGTGKTRLLRELQERNLGEPLLVAADAPGGGLQSNSALFSDLASRYIKNPENLWWTLLDAALNSKSTVDLSFKNILDKTSSNRASAVRVSAIARKASAIQKNRVFLIDGVETAFRAGELPQFVEGLFRFILTVQTESLFSRRVAIRLFLRTDLARNAIQNIEQQTSGRTLDLVWNAQAIFNFVLSRIGQIRWFEENFSDAVNEIRAQFKRIQVGDLREEEYEPLLLEIFPKRLRRNNLQTLTFLKTYFSDASGDDEARAAFYPRLFTTFLDLIAAPDNLPKGKIPAAVIEDKRIHQALVLAAHEEASKRYLHEVQQELAFLLELSSDKKENESLVKQLLSAFDGLRTPFNVEERIGELKGKLRRISRPSLRESLTRMKDIGMFEERPRYPGQWRAGRLFKSALNMKYVRG